jgi:PAS domain S-box-containing protein
MPPLRPRAAPKKSSLYLVAASWRRPGAGANEFASAFDNAPIGMAVVAPDSRRLQVNKALCAMLGFTQAELLSDEAHHITHPEDLTEDLVERGRCLAGEKMTYQREKRYVHRDGRIVWAHLTCTLVRDGDGRPLHFISQVQDITERKLAEQRLRDTQAFLHMAAQMGRLGAWAYDVRARSVIWSGELCAIHEIRPGSMPRPRDVLAFFAPEWRDAMRTVLRACVRNGTPFDVEAQVITARGRLVWVRVIGEAEWDARGRVCRLQGACQDITETKRDATARNAAQQEILRLNAELEERVAQRTAQLEAANRELEAFSYSIAHDLRAPLSSIDGFSQVLEESGGKIPAERASHYLSRIRAAVRHMGDLTDGLLALANLSRAAMRDDAVDLSALARAALASCREREPARAVDSHIAQSLPVRGDPRLLSQVVGNLVGNAWKFTALRERARIEVGSEVDAQGRRVYFVRDNGAGFDMAFASRMFEAFQRMHSQTEFPGTGIGLAIVHKIVTRHGGRIWAKSAPQQGATLFFTLGTARG